MICHLRVGLLTQETSDRRFRAPQRSVRRSEVCLAEGTGRANRITLVDQVLSPAAEGCGLDLALVPLGKQSELIDACLLAYEAALAPAQALIERRPSADVVRGYLLASSSPDESNLGAHGGPPDLVLACRLRGASAGRRLLSDYLVAESAERTRWAAAGVLATAIFLSMAGPVVVAAFDPPEGHKLRTWWFFLVWTASSSWIAYLAGRYDHKLLPLLAVCSCCVSPLALPFSLAAWAVGALLARQGYRDETAPL